MDNIILHTDAYKYSHFKQYPPGTSEVYCYFESRGGKFPYTVFFGLQYIFKKYFIGQVITEEKIQKAKKLATKVLQNTDTFNEKGWRYILEKHEGRLPLRICAVQEGSTIPVKNVLFTVVNTDPKCFWLPGFVETILVQAWYPVTVATNSRIQKQIISHFLSETHDDVNSLKFKLYDCGFRGISSVESAAIGSAAHMINFSASDTIAGITLLEDYYHADQNITFGYSASEHSTVTSWGREGELESYRNMLKQFPNGPVTCVSDSYSIWNSIEKIWGEELRDEVLERGKRGGITVIRPDSGDPPSVVLKCLELLEAAYGSELNKKGYKMLPPYIRLFQADGISWKSLEKTLQTMKDNDWSAENVTFGSGGGLLQKLDRDTQKCAYKCSEVCVDGVKRDVYKDPITDPGKTSKRGRLQLRVINGEYRTIQGSSDDTGEDLLMPVFEDGVLLQDWTLDQVRAAAQLTNNDPDILTIIKNLSDN